MWNEKLGEIMRSKAIDLEKLLCCQSKIKEIETWKKAFLDWF